MKGKLKYFIYRKDIPTNYQGYLMYNKYNNTQRLQDKIILLQSYLPEITRSRHNFIVYYFLLENPV